MGAVKVARTTFPVVREFLTYDTKSALISRGGSMFKEVLRDIVERTEGGVAALLMGYDGIPVDNFVSDEATVDVESIGMEYSVILTQITKAAEMLDAGAAREVCIQADKLTTIVRFLTPEYFVAITMQPGGNFGKARFLLRTQATKLTQDLI